MAVIDDCPNCKRIRFDWEPHHCAPRWYAWIRGRQEVGDLDDGRVVFADEAEDAAKAALKESDDWNGEGFTDKAVVHVSPANNPSEVSKFHVGGELEVRYWARAAK